MTENDNFYDGIPEQQNQIPQAATDRYPDPSQAARESRPSARTYRVAGRSRAAQPSRTSAAPSPYARTDTGRYTGAGAKKKLTRRNFLIGTAAVLGVGIVGATAWGVNFISSIGTRLNENVTDETMAVLQEQQSAAQNLVSNWTDTTPFYMLMLGVDSDEGRLSDEEEYGTDPQNYRSDTIILTRIDPGEKKVCLISIHRDTLVEIDGREQKINSAYSLGGAAKSIEVVSDFAGVPISHYAEVNIDALIAITDAMGGVVVDVPYEIDDWEYMMGHLDAGVQRLDGRQAELFCRDRRAYDNLGDGDRYRAANQRLFIYACLDQLMNLSPLEMVNVLNVAVNYVTTDLTLDQIVNLALAMRGIDTQNNVYSTMNPTTNDYVDGVWVEYNDDEKWAQIMEAVDAGEKPPVDTDYVSVTDDINSPTHGQTAENPASVAVRNASGDESKTAPVVSQLTAAGWNAWDAGMVDSVYEDTTVVYEDPLRASDARAIAQTLGCGYESTADTWALTSGCDIMVVLGA